MPTANNLNRKRILCIKIMHSMYYYVTGFFFGVVEPERKTFKYSAGHGHWHVIDKNVNI